MRVYSVTMQNQTVVADETLVIVHSDSTTGSSGSSLTILRAWVGQHGTVTSQQLGIMLALKATAFGTYTATTPQQHFMGTGASAITGATTGAESTAGTDASVEGAGTVTPVIYDAFNNLNGWLWVPTPEERLRLGPDQAVILKLVGTPTSLVNWSAGITFLEES